MNEQIELTHNTQTGNFWIDTGLAVLLCEFGEGKHCIESIRSWLVSCLVQPTGNKGYYYDVQKDKLQEYEKKNWVYPANLFIKVAGASGTKKKVDGKEYPTQPPVFDLNLEMSQKKGICDVCGQTSALTDAKMWQFPFVVEPSKFGNFYSSAKRGLRLCARCALAGLAGYLGWLWKTQGRDVLHFFLFHAELRSLTELQRAVVQPLNMQRSQGGNAPVAFFGPFLHEATLGLLLWLFAEVKQRDSLSEEGKRTLQNLFGAQELKHTASPLTLYAVTGQIGQAVKINSVVEISKLMSLYRLYDKWITILRNGSPNPHEQIVTVFRQFEARQGNKLETVWRDRVARAILEFTDPVPSIESFLYDVRARQKPAERRALAYGTEDILNHYLQEVLNMPEEVQKTLAGFGRSLGVMVHERKEMGLLYALRNSKNPEQFYRVLNDIQFRLGMTVPEPLLRIGTGERIADVPWVRVKTLLSIYAMNAYLRKETRGEESANDTTTMEE